MSLSSFEVAGPGLGPWHTATPESVGLSEQELMASAAAARETVANRQCYMVVKEGKVVYQEYYGDFTESSTRQLWSVTKSMGSTLVGMAVEDSGLDVTTLMEDYYSDTSAVEGSTVENVLTMTAHHSPPGSRFQYDVVGRHALNDLSDVVANVTGTPTDEFMREKLIGDLGMEDFYWPSRRAGNLFFGFSSFGSCRDMARVGQLWMNQGEWKESGRLVPADYIRKGSTHVFPDAGPEDGYGYTVWKMPGDIVYFSGMFGQCVIIDRASDAIVVSAGRGSITGSCCKVWAASKDAISGGQHQEHLSCDKLKAEKVDMEEVAYGLMNPDTMSDYELQQLLDYVDQQHTHTDGIAWANLR